MQSIAAFFTAMFMMIGAFFGGLSNAILVWDKPTQTITNTAQVLTLYKTYAAKNTETEFRERLDSDDLVDGRTDLFSRFINAWAQAAIHIINPRVAEVVKGVPGTPKDLKAGDITAAKAEYYHNGKTLVITLRLLEQVDTYNGKSSSQAVTRGLGNISDMSFNSVKVQVARLGYTLKSATMTYSNASITIRVDVESGKIVKADYSYHAVISAIRNEVATPFQQSFDYSLKRP